MHTMEFSRDDLEEILFSVLQRERQFPHSFRRDIANRIAKELGLE